MDAELNSERLSTAGTSDGPSQDCESSIAGPLGLEEAASAATADGKSEEGSLTIAAREEGQAGVLGELSGVAEKISSAGVIGGDNQVGNSSVAIASSAETAVDPLRDALTAVDRKEYATAQRFFEALGQKTAAATAPPEPVVFAGGSMAASDSRAQQKPAQSLLDVIPSLDTAFRRPLPHAKKAKSRRPRSILLGSGFVLFAICGAYAIAIYGAPPNWLFAATKSQAIAVFASAADVLKASVEAITRLTWRDEERSEARDLRAATPRTSAPGAPRLQERAYGSAAAQLYRKRRCRRPCRACQSRERPRRRTGAGMGVIALGRSSVSCGADGVCRSPSRMAGRRVDSALARSATALQFRGCGEGRRLFR